MSENHESPPREERRDPECPRRPSPPLSRASTVPFSLIDVIAGIRAAASVSEEVYGEDSERLARGIMDRAEPRLAKLSNTNVRRTCLVTARCARIT